ncbi:BMC domain-containing protein [Edwardsiella tarda]|uniref:BMC domain-containing protein n=1 Tax=Edwardsiella tarda TaxID=636 RepID=UPI00351C2CE7
MKPSLGLLEVKGLALAIACADVMAKAAAITLLDLEKTQGAGWMTIPICGDVASVQCAILAGAELAARQGGLVAQRIIARPGTGILAWDSAMSSASPPPLGSAPSPRTEPLSAQETPRPPPCRPPPPQISPVATCATIRPAHGARASPIHAVCMPVREVK